MSDRWGCRTGFYFITRDKISKARAIELVQETCEFIKNFEGEIPGSSRIECGNYLNHSLPKAKKYAEDLSQDTCRLDRRQDGLSIVILEGNV